MDIIKIGSVELTRAEAEKFCQEGVRFIKVGKHLHYIDEDSSVTEKTTGIAHKEAEWLIDIKRA